MNECAKCREPDGRSPLWRPVRRRTRPPSKPISACPGMRRGVRGDDRNTQDPRYDGNGGIPGPISGRDTGTGSKSASTRSPRPATRPARGRVRRSFALFPAWAFRAAAAAALLVVGILIGRTLLRPPAPRVARTHPRPSTPAPGVEQASAPVLRARDYFERSKLILLGLVNYDPAASDVYGLDLPRQKQLSRALVNEAGSLKNDLKAPAQKRLRELVARPRDHPHPDRQPRIGQRPRRRRARQEGRGRKRASS